MKPQIRLIDGLHLTATDKRNLLAVIEFERASPPEVWGTRWLGLPKSPKSYAVLPDPEKPGSRACDDGCAVWVTAVLPIAG